MVDWTAIAGILGTLGGMGIGAYVSWRNNAATLKAQDRTRFHAHRLEVCVEFSRTSQDIFFAVAEGKTPGQEELSRHSVARETIRLISTPKVGLAAEGVVSLVADAVMCKPPDLPTMNAFHSKIDEYITAVREELTDSN